MGCRSDQEESGPHDRDIELSTLEKVVEERGAIAMPMMERRTCVVEGESVPIDYSGEALRLLVRSTQAIPCSLVVFSLPPWLKVVKLPICRRPNMMC